MTMTPTDLNLFANNLMLTLHEITHVLGFSGGSMEYWADKTTKAYIGTAGKAAITTV
jgi:proprotein convertase subtilisin/kexin type 5